MVYAGICLYMPEYAQINKILNMLQVLNVPKFRIWQSSEYVRVVDMQALHSVLSMPEYALAGV